MDIITLLTDKLNERLTDGHLLYKPADVADMLTQAAQELVFAAAVGNTVKDTLTIDQLGAVLVALQWNVNPAIRAGVKVR